MGILNSVLVYESEKHNYTTEEQTRIEASLRRDCKEVLSEASKALNDAIEVIKNDMDDLNEC